MNLESGANTVYVTVKEKSTLANPTFVFVFINELNQKFMVTNTDQSTSTAQRSKFTLTVQASPNWQSGQVYPTQNGDYVYYVYETDNVGALVYNTVIAADIRDYVPTYFTTLCETGVMRYHAAAGTDHTYKSVEAAGKTYTPSV